VNLNVNFNILKQFDCALVGRMRDLKAKVVYRSIGREEV